MKRCREIQSCICRCCADHHAELSAFMYCCTEAPDSDGNVSMLSITAQKKFIIAFFDTSNKLGIIFEGMQTSQHLCCPPWFQLQNLILKIFTWKNIYTVNSDHQWWVGKEYLLSNLLQFFLLFVTLRFRSFTVHHFMSASSSDLYADISPFWKLIVVSLTNTCTFTFSRGLLRALVYSEWFEFFLLPNEPAKDRREKNHSTAT